MAEMVKKENHQVVFKFTVPAAEFAKAEKAAYAKTKNRYNIPGFRKGKAPMSIIEKQYGEGIFFEDAINTALPEFYEAAVKALGLDPVDRPDIDILEVGKGKDCVVEATVTVKPEVEMVAYKGVEVEQAIYEVKEEDVDAEIDRERNMSARMVTVEDRPIQDGDTVVIDYKGYLDGELFDGGSAENHNLVIGSKAFIEGFEEQLIGHEAGEALDIEVSFPEDYHAEHLAGKPVKFEVMIHSIKFKELPALDDEFAKDVSEFDTLEAYKASIKENLATKNAERSKNETRENVIKAVVDGFNIDVPEAMLNNEIDNMLYDFDYQLRYQGLDLETYLKYTNSSREDLKEQMKEDADARVRTSLVIEAITKAENMQATDEEVEAELVKIAEQQKTDVEKIRKTYQRDDYGMVRGMIESRKTVDLLVEHAKLK